MLANVLGMAIGFTLGVVLRSSAGAIVGYFVYSLVLPTASRCCWPVPGVVPDLQPWIDFNYAQIALFDGSLTGEMWAQLGVAALIWLVVPLAVGLLLLRRSEVK